MQDNVDSPPEQPDLSRRSFARAGLSGTVVLGSLASKPVLGAEYICTVSGHTSGNASAHDTRVDCDVGDGVKFWLHADPWPFPYKKGALPKAVAGTDSCTFTPEQGTVFNGLTVDGRKLQDTFYYRSATNGCGVRLAPAGGAGTSLAKRQASLYQVLASTQTSEVFRLGRATVVSLLNAAKYGTTYPVSAGRVIEMFNAVVDGGSYHVAGANLSLTRKGVIDYLEKLYS